MGIPKEYAVAVGETIVLGKAIHVQLPYEGFELTVSEIVRKDHLLQSLRVFDLDVQVIITPANDLPVAVLLQYRHQVTSRML